MYSKTNYITGRTSEFNEFGENIPVHLEAGGILLCTSGTGEVIIDSKQYSVKKWDMIVGLPHSYVHAIHTSSDFDGIIFGVDIDLLINTDLLDRSFYITAISENPSISLDEEDVKKILNLREKFLEESAKTDNPLRKEIDEAILKVLIYEVAALFHNSKPNRAQKQSRDDIIFNHFLVQLHNREVVSRNLEEFAQTQSITPSHLSKVVKRVSGRSASDWISRYTIMTIKRLLQNKELSIATIADMLNFPNASFLAQYFKKHTAQTPKSYRTQFLSGV